MSQLSCCRTPVIGSLRNDRKKRPTRWSSFFKSLIKLIRIFIREQRWLSTCMEEQHSLVLLKEPLADQINHPRRGASCIDRIQQKTLILRKQLDGFALRFGQYAVACFTIIGICQHFSRSELNPRSELFTG